MVGYLREGWKRVMENPLPVLGILLLESIVNVIPYVGGILTFFLTPLFIAMVLAILYKEARNTVEAFRVAKDRYLDFLLASIFLSILFIVFLLFFAIVFVVPVITLNNLVLTVLGIVLALVVTVLIMVKFTPVYHYLIKGLDVTDAFREAWKVPFVTSFKIAVCAFLIPALVLLFFIVLVFLPLISLAHTGLSSISHQLLTTAFYLLVLDTVLVLLAAIIVRAWTWGIYAVASEDLLKEAS